MTAKTCSDCKHWKVSPAQILRDGFARCGIDGHYAIKPATHTCGSHKPATPAQIAIRRAA